jgi:hypothetical protein
MAEEKFCDQCNQQHNCSNIYNNLGNTNGPSVVVNVVIAFLLPIIIFIISLWIFEEIFVETINNQPVKILLSMVSALAVAFSFILIIKLITKRLGKVG